MLVKRLKFLVLIVLAVGGLCLAQPTRVFAPRPAAAQQAEAGAKPPAPAPAEAPATFPPIPDDPAGSDRRPPVPADASLPGLTVLVLGLDSRTPTTEPGNTDTLMLVRLDRQRQTLSILSIPRDLWVAMPGLGHRRINTAYALGERAGPGQGAALAKEVVSDLLGIAIDRAVIIRFAAVEHLVDTVGGIDVDVPVAIHDPTFPDDQYGYDPLVVAAGRQHFDGRQALRYARTRHTAGGDFDRAQRQQQVVLAILERLRQPSVWPGLVASAPSLWNQGSGLFTTDMSVDEVLRLAWSARALNRDRISSAVLGPGYAMPWTTSTGGAVLLPQSDRIAHLVQDLFGQP